MKKKKYGWLRRCLSLMCVLVLISMIVLQSVPVTYASSEPDAFTSGPEDNSQTISTAEIPTGDDTQPGNQLVDDIFSEGNSETSPEIPADDNSEMLSNSPVEGNQDETSENISGTQEGEISDVSQNPSSEPEQETSSEIADDQQDELTSGENTVKENPDSEQPDSESNINPQQENEDIWKDSIATAALTGDYAKDITAIARTQLGVQENKDNFITAEDGTIHCYSRYGQWAGDAYEEWSAAFVNFCAHYANIPQQYLPKSEKVSQWIQQLEAMSLHIEKEGYTPKEGDLVFFLTNEHAEGNSQIQTDTPAHTGIVTAADEQYLYTIEGNCGGTVQEEKYGLASDNIYGYLDMDQVKKLAGVLQEEPADPAEPETPADSEEPKDSEQNGNEENNEENNDTQDDKSEDQPEVLEWKNDDVTITAEALTEDAITAGTTLNVIPVEKDNNETAFQYSEVEAELQKKAENEEYEIVGFLAYDIKLVNADGEDYEPDGRVKISMKYNEPAAPELKNQDNSDEELNITVMHLEEDDTGNVTGVVDLKKTDFGENFIRSIETDENQALRNIEFSADSFSVYAVTWTNALNDNLGDDSLNTSDENTTVVTEKELSHEKYVKYNPKTDDYDLTLNVSGAIGSASVKYKLDVLFVMDTSNSMKDSMSGDKEYDDYVSNADSRFYNQQRAIENAVSTLGQKSNVDAQYAIVAFDTKAGIYTNWTTKDGIIYPSKVANYGAGRGHQAGGTNYEDALKQAKSLLSKARNGASTIVIFLSDGDPTYYNSDWGDSVKGNGTYYEPTAMTKAGNVLSGMQMNYFYMVGVGPQSKYTKLNTLNEYVPAGIGKAEAAYNGISANALDAAFKNIISDVTELRCSNVEITDTLSEYAELVSGSTLTVAVKKLDKYGNSESVTQLAVPLSDEKSELRSVEAVMKAYTETENGKTKIKVTFDPPSYKLESGYTYYVTAKIKATDQAYKKFEESGYIHEGEAFTDENIGADKKPGNDTANNGTSSNQGGFFCNDSAEVTYIYNDKSEVKDYKKPVIQIKRQIYELPSSGGFGIYPLTIGGAAVLGTALLLFINSKRKEEVSGQ